MQPRTATREFGIIIFCILGIILLNGYAHNKYRLPSVGALIESILPSTEYQPMSLFQLLSGYQEDPKSLEALDGVEVEGQILKEKAVDPTDPNYADSEKVGKTFRLSRRFSETGSEEGASVLRVEVNYRDPEILAPNMWIRVRGKVLSGKDDDGKPAPVINAKRVVQMDAPENPILTPSGGGEMGGHDGHEGHSH